MWVLVIQTGLSTQLRAYEIPAFGCWVTSRVAFGHTGSTQVPAQSRSASATRAMAGKQARAPDERSGLVLCVAMLRDAVCRQGFVRNDSGVERSSRS
jgi:hypothetical protein